MGRKKRCRELVESREGYWAKIRGKKGGVLQTSMGTNSVFRKTPGTSGYLSLPLSLSLSLLFLSVFHPTHVTQPLKDLEVLMSSNVHHGVCCWGCPWVWVGPWSSYGCASDQRLMLTNLCLRLIVCVHACVCVLNTDLTPATPTREFLSGLDRGRMSQQTNIYVHKHCKTGVV